VPPRIKVTTLESQLIHLIQELSGRTLKLSYPAFSGSNLTGWFVSHFYSLLAICLSSTGRSVQQAQNCLACSVKRITSFGPTIQFRRKGNDCICYGCIMIAHGTIHHPAAQEGRKFITQTALRQCDPLWITLFPHGCGFQAK
jgi:hypothetical protein